MSSYELVKSKFAMPFDLYPFQIEATDELAPLPRTGLYFSPGLGKTAVSTHCALAKGVQVYCLVPPTIVTQWCRWWAKIRREDGSALRVVAYRGTPKVREQINIADWDVVVMSMGIFKNDIDRIHRDAPANLHVILDEAHCVKNIGTANYKQFRAFVSTRSYQLLTGTPLNNPLDAYAYVKLVAPEVYRNYAQFERIHVAERDFFKNPIAFANLDVLQQNLLLNSVLKTKEDVLHDLPEAIIQGVEYDLQPKHLALYRTLANEQLLKLPDGAKIDATSAQALLHALGQIVMQWAYFAQDDSLKAAGYDLLEEILEELGDKKLVVFANYRRTNADIVKRYGCQGIWGDVSAREKERAWNTFLDSDRCRMITLQPTSAGVGLDGAQHVCQDALYLEPPIAVSHFIQSFSRIHREGQKNVVTVRMASAIGTLQQYMTRRLSEKEDLVQPLQGSKAVLKAALFGD